MKKQISILIILIAFFATMLTGCFTDPDFDFEDAGYIEIMAAEQRIKVTDSETVSKITADVAEREYERVVLVGDEADEGYIYTAYYTLTWYNSDGVAIESIEISEADGSCIAHDAIVYTVENGSSIDIAAIEAVLNTK